MDPIFTRCRRFSITQCEIEGDFWILHADGTPFAWSKRRDGMESVFALLDAFPGIEPWAILARDPFVIAYTEAWRHERFRNCWVDWLNQ